MITIYHWDLPKSLQQLGGFTNPKIVHYFEKFADILFGRYGNRVRTWITFNEPWMFCNHHYLRNGKPFFNFKEGIDNYLCSHHVLLANAKIYNLYKSKYSRHKGRIGISVNGLYGLPKDDKNPMHIAAADRKLQFGVGLTLFCMHIVITKSVLILDGAIHTSDLQQRR